MVGELMVAAEAEQPCGMAHRRKRPVLMAQSPGAHDPRTHVALVRGRQSAMPSPELPTGTGEETTDASSGRYPVTRSWSADSATPAHSLTAVALPCPPTWPGGYGPRVPPARPLGQAEPTIRRVVSTVPPEVVRHSTGSCHLARGPGRADGQAGPAFWAPARRAGGRGVVAASHGPSLYGC